MIKYLEQLEALTDFRGEQVMNTDHTENWAVETADGTCVCEGLTREEAIARRNELNTQAAERLGAAYERRRDGFYARHYGEDE